MTFYQFHQDSFSQTDSRKLRRDVERLHGGDSWQGDEPEDAGLETLLDQVAPDSLIPVDEPRSEPEQTFPAPARSVVNPQPRHPLDAEESYYPW